jgi:hypothetical protein
MVFNATFNNIASISWRSVLLVEYSVKTTALLQVTDELLYSPKIGMFNALPGNDL